MFNIFEDNVADFIKSQSKAVIATVDSENQPSTSVIFYIVDKNDEMFFITKSHTTKFENIKSNSKRYICFFRKFKIFIYHLGFSSLLLSKRK